MTNQQRRTFRCLQCNFIWIQFVKDDTERPDVCPKCNSHDWDKSKKTPSHK